MHFDFVKLCDIDHARITQRNEANVIGGTNDKQK